MFTKPATTQTTIHPNQIRGGTFTTGTYTFPGDVLGGTTTRWRGWADAHDFGAKGDGVANDTGALQAACVAAAGGTTTGPGVTGRVVLRAGTYLVTNKIGTRGCVFIGDGRGNTGGSNSIIKANAAGGGAFLLDAATERDGISANTDGNGAGLENLTINCNSNNWNGFRAFGSGFKIRNVEITGCVDAFTGSLVINAELSGGNWFHDNTGKGVFITAPNAQQGTSFNCFATWSQNNAYGFYINNLYYSTFTSCVAQGSTTFDWYVDGSQGGQSSLYSLTFNTIGSENNSGTHPPMYFKAVRDLNLISPRIITPASPSFDLITLDNVGGTVLQYSTVQTPAGGFFKLKSINNAVGTTQPIAVINSNVTTNADTDFAYINTIANGTYRWTPTTITLGGGTGSGFPILARGFNNVIVQDGTGSTSSTLQAGVITDTGSACTNGELALSAGWQSTGSATVTAVVGNSQTCSWTITTGTTTAANPTVTDTLVNPMPAATTVCEMNIHGGTHTAAAGEGFQQTTLSATAPVFTFNGTPTAGGTTYLITRRCGP